ncbi:MAG: amino acid ABC transporter ATP-binding protein [Coriobacteriaceae bacterium]|nr:amino acid ABC transporter ATP-binding protein [Coriobacteriaceae bacterium]
MLPDAPCVLEIKDAYKGFGTVEVLKGVSLSVHEGEVVALIGSSGGGKSTLLRCASLLERLDSGEIYFADRAIAKSAEVSDFTPEAGAANPRSSSIYLPKKELRSARAFFGLVFQNFNLFPHYTALRNITEPLMAVEKMDNKAAEARGVELLTKMGLAEKADAYPFQLSGGQQQRVAIARALAPSPKILYFDEPTSALDPEITAEILKIIRDLAAENMTMLIVTHEINFARNVADRVAFMDQGLILETGFAKELIDNPTNERTRAFLSKLGDND